METSWSFLVSQWVRLRPIVTFIARELALAAAVTFFVLWTIERFARGFITDRLNLAVPLGILLGSAALATLLGSPFSQQRQRAKSPPLLSYRTIVLIGVLGALLGFIGTSRLGLLRLGISLFTGVTSAAIAAVFREPRAQDRNDHP